METCCVLNKFFLIASEDAASQGTTQPDADLVAAEARYLHVSTTE